MTLVSNPWFIGIGGGILSGLIVTLITRAIFSRRENREYAQKVTVANHEVLYAIRPGISEGVIPKNEVIRSLAAATARRYGVKVSDMHDLNAVSSELVKEVMDSSFISAQSKQEFCSKLSSIKEEQPEKVRPEMEAEHKQATLNRRQMAFMLGIMSGVMTAVAIVGVGIKPEEFTDTRKLVLFVVPAVVAILASILSILFKEVEKLKLKRLDLSVGGFKAEFTSKDKAAEEKDA